MNISKRMVVVMACIVIFEMQPTATMAQGCSDGAAKSDSCGMSNHKHVAKEERHACSSEMMQKYQFLATMLIYLDSPTVIYARAQELGLSDEQKTRLLAIAEESRKAALAELTVEQRQKLGDISNEPIIMSQICPTMNSEAVKAHAGHNSPTESVKTDETKISESAKTPEQKTCPVMGGTINKDLFTVYKGKKVYFCCSGCIGKFEKEPDKYLPKLPQFTK